MNNSEHISSTLQTPVNLDTHTLLKHFLSMGYDVEYKFLVPLGKGAKTMQRVRVALSRRRKILRDRRIACKRFKLQSTIELTELGDLVTVICQQSTTDQLDDVFDALLAAEESE